MQKFKELEVTPQQSVSDEDLQLINVFARKTLTADEVYTFSVVLCDNDIDRDFEYFTNDALEKLSQLFVGVTGIYDHNPTAKNQVARIYDCCVEKITAQKTEYGEDYCRLFAKAYLPRCDGNSDLIAMLDAGIKKEVSVGCSIGECRCSICGESLRDGCCGHKKGEVYDGKMCCGVLTEPLDAYEWSFTAVPSQRRAGVIKSFLSTTDGTRTDGEALLKRAAKADGSITVTEEELNVLKSYVEDLKHKSEQSERYKSMLELETVKAGITAKTEIESDLLEAMVKGLSIDELLRLKESFEKKTAKIFPIHTQLAEAVDRKDNSNHTEKFSQYSI